MCEFLFSTWWFYFWNDFYIIFWSLVIISFNCLLCYCFCHNTVFVLAFLMSPRGRRRKFAEKREVFYVFETLWFGTILLKRSWFLLWMTVTRYLFYFCLEIEYLVAAVFYKSMFRLSVWHSVSVRSTACCNRGKLQFIFFW